jgi:hypothetical protein
MFRCTSPTGRSFSKGRDSSASWRQSDFDILTPLARSLPGGAGLAAMGLGGDGARGWYPAGWRESKSESPLQFPRRRYT